MNYTADCRSKISRPRIVIRVVMLVISTAFLSSCAVVRGLVVDGAGGPDIYSFEHHAHDTIANGAEVFRFPVATVKAEWIDTLHFYSQPYYCENITFLEALNRKSQTQGVLIIQDDSIVYEHYWGDFSADRLATVFSVSKSITSLLCGIAVDEGYIHSIDDPVTRYLPELTKRDTMWQHLTLRHLLDMRSGLDFDDTYSLTLKDLKRLNAMARLNYGHHLMRQIRGLEFRCEPGTDHRYESMTSQILGVVIERATGKRYADYLSEKVWQPLQMESPALVNVDSRRHDMAHAFGGVTLTMKDLAKIGRLYLNRGVWDGKRIVSEEWIRQSTEYNTDNDGYHFNWYNLSNEGKAFTKAEYHGYYALGIYAQVLYVNPYKNLIMVRVGRGNGTDSIVPALFEQLSQRFANSR
ncbi:MAG: serine hydrolase [Bacteroidales bacterium]|nr:serine hydrolase [Bacteroidales bacterium]